MVDSDSQEKFKAWANERSTIAGAVVAVRAMLRAIPAVSLVSDVGDHLLSLYRAAALGVASLQTDVEFAQEAAVAKSAYRDAQQIENRAGRSVIASAAAVARMFDANSARNMRGAIVGSVSASCGAFVNLRSGRSGDDEDLFWSYVYRDIESIGEDVFPRHLMTVPLWWEGRERYTGNNADLDAQQYLLSLWDGLKRSLLDEGRAWEVWVDWYDRILDGVADYSSEVGVFRVTLDRPENWNLPIYAINTMIRKKIGDVADLPQSSNAAFDSPPALPNLPDQSDKTELFSTDPVRPTDLELDDGAATLGTSPERREGYEELQSLAADLFEMGGNRLGGLSGPCSRFQSLGKTADKVRVFPFWVRANALRNVLRGHEAAERTVEPDERRLDAVVADQLQTFVEAFQAYCLGDIRLLRNEQSRPGPRETRSAHEELEPLKCVIQSMVSDTELATERAAAVLSDARTTIEVASEDLPARQGAELGRRTLSNLVLSLLVKAKLSLGPEGSFAWKEMQSAAYKRVGDAALVGVALEVTGYSTITSTFLHFMAANADTLIVYAKLTAMNPGVVSFLRWIQAQFGS